MALKDRLRAKDLECSILEERLSDLRDSLIQLQSEAEPRLPPTLSGGTIKSAMTSGNPEAGSEACVTVSRCSTCTASGSSSSSPSPSALNVPPNSHEAHCCPRSDSGICDAASSASMMHRAPSAPQSHQPDGAAMSALQQLLSVGSLEAVYGIQQIEVHLEGLHQELMRASSSLVAAGCRVSSLSEDVSGNRELTGLQQQHGSEETMRSDADEGEGKDKLDPVFMQRSRHSVFDGSDPISENWEVVEMVEEKFPGEGIQEERALLHELLVELLERVAWAPLDFPSSWEIPLMPHYSGSTALLRPPLSTAAMSSRSPILPHTGVLPVTAEIPPDLPRSSQIRPAAFSSRDQAVALCVRVVKSSACRTLWSLVLKAEGSAQRSGRGSGQAACSSGWLEIPAGEVASSRGAGEGIPTAAVARFAGWVDHVTTELFESLRPNRPRGRWMGGQASGAEEKTRALLSRLARSAVGLWVLVTACHPLMRLTVSSPGRELFAEGHCVVRRRRTSALRAGTGSIASADGCGPSHGADGEATGRTLGDRCRRSVAGSRRPGVSFLIADSASSEAERPRVVIQEQVTATEPDFNGDPRLKGRTDEDDVGDGDAVEDAENDSLNIVSC